MLRVAHVVERAVKHRPQPLVRVKHQRVGLLHPLPRVEHHLHRGALGIKELAAPDPATYLEAAIDYANNDLWGTLGCQILIHPKTIRQIGRKRFEEILAKLRYGTIGINGWCGLGFLIPACPWGAFPGHTLEDVGSGIGTVHNAFMLEDTERTVVRAPWLPFPRGLLSGQFSLLPRPPFFITNRRQHKIGQALTAFQYRPGWLKLPKIFLNALMG